MTIKLQIGNMYSAGFPHTTHPREHKRDTALFIKN